MVLRNVASVVLPIFPSKKQSKNVMVPEYMEVNEDFASLFKNEHILIITVPLISNIP